MRPDHVVRWPKHRREIGQPAARQAARRRQGGFTLIELLVSLVILGFVMTLVSEAVFQVAKVTRAADATTRSLAARWGAGWSASTLFANLLAPDLEKDAPVLRGSATRVEGYTSRPLDGADTGITAFGLALRPGASAADETEMYSVAAESYGGPNKAPALVAAFPGRAEFAYINRAGETLGIWPPPTRNGLDPEDLPKAVLVRDANAGGVLMWYGFPGETIREQRVVSPFARTLP